MGVDASGLDDLEGLIAAGKLSADASVEEIAAYLQGQSPAPAPSKDDDDAGEDKGGNGAVQADGKAAKSADDKSADATDDKKGGDTSSDTAQHDDSEGPIISPSGKAIPFGVLKGTREQLARAQENLKASAQARQQDQETIIQLREQLAAASKATPSQAQEVQQIADRAGVTDASGRPVDVTKIDVSALRGEFPDAVVDVIEALQNTVVHHERTIRDLNSRDATRTKSERLTAEEQLQADIDAVPFIAQLQADEKDLRWDAAVAMDGRLAEDPEWSGKSRVERFQHIAKLLLGGASEEPPAESAPAPVPGKQAATPAQVKQTVDGALKRAAARAAPTSLTDLPAGSPAAQSDQQALETMDTLDLAAKFATMSQSQIDAYLAKHG